MITEPTKEDLRPANRAITGIGVSNGEFPTAAPSALSDAMGKIPDGNILTVELGTLGTGSAVISMLVWSVPQQKWVYPGSNAANFTKTFSSANLPAYDFFKGCAGQAYYLKSDTANIKGYDNGDEYVLGKK